MDSNKVNTFLFIPTLLFCIPFWLNWYTIFWYFTVSELYLEIDLKYLFIFISFFSGLLLFIFVLINFIVFLLICTLLCSAALTPVASSPPSGNVCDKANELTVAKVLFTFVLGSNILNYIFVSLKKKTLNYIFKLLAKLNYIFNLSSPRRLDS